MTEVCCIYKQDIVDIRFLSQSQRLIDGERVPQSDWITGNTWAHISVSEIFEAVGFEVSGDGGNTIIISSVGRWRAVIEIDREDRGYTFRYTISENGEVVNSFTGQNTPQNIDGRTMLDSSMIGELLFHAGFEVEREYLDNVDSDAVGAPFILRISSRGVELDITAPNLVTASNWAHDGINNAFANGLIPQNLQSQYTQAATRAEFAAFAVALYEAVTGREITERATFNDTTDINVQKMGGLGIVTGVGGGDFNPSVELTREQAAVMLARLAYAMGQPLSSSAPTLADNNNISSWAVDSVGQIQAAGIMGGVGNNNFAPDGEYTREQSIITMLRLFELLN